MWDGIRVLDLSDEQGQMCGMMLADLGADVVCIEPPGGSNARCFGPFADGVRDTETSLYWWSYARNKRSAVIDLESASGRDQLRALAAKADIVIETEKPGRMAELGLGHDDLARLNPRLITVSITPFGQEGPKANWPASDLTVLAAGGPLWLTGEHDRAPSRVRVPQGYNNAGCEAASAALIALHEREVSGLGQHVDVSAQQAVTLATQSDIVADLVGVEGVGRYGGGMAVGPVVLRFVYPAADGHVAVTHVFGSTIGPATQRMMNCVHADGFCDEAMRAVDWVNFQELILNSISVEYWEEAKAAIAAWSGSKTKAELLKLAMEKKLLIAPISTPRDALESEQLASRDYFVEMERPDGKAGLVKTPGAWAQMTRSALRMGRRAPRLGEHTEEVLAEIPAEPPAPVAMPKSAAAPNRRPLEGVKILDFMWAVAGPAATRMLADNGAEIVRVESTTRLDVCRTLHPVVAGDGPDRAALFHSVNAGKRMMTLDLANAEAREVILDLVRWADVVCESFTPGTMDKLGFGYEALCEVNPEVIMLSTCLMGQTGPVATFAGYGNLGAALGGFHELAGWEDRAPAGPYSAYTDYIAPRYSAAAVLAALEHRRRTGEGQHLDVSQAEVGLHFLAPAILAQSVNRETWSRRGNHDEVLAPHGCYPVIGEDRWLAVAVEGDAQWRDFCEVLGLGALVADPRFADAGARRENFEALDGLLSEKTAERKGEEFETELIARGIAAHQVLDSRGLCADPQLNARGHFLKRSKGELETVIEAPRAQLSRTPPKAGDEIPTFGADNHWVLSELLGYDDDRCTEIVISGALD